MIANSKNRIPSLDGLRAVSIALVIFGHLCGTQGFFGQALYRRTGDVANLGVRTFFVISGYLIMAVLPKELDRTGTISLRRFYFRRTLRIFPVAYVFLAVMTILAGLGLPLAAVPG